MKSPLSLARHHSEHRGDSLIYGSISEVQCIFSVNFANSFGHYIYGCASSVLLYWQIYDSLLTDKGGNTYKYEPDIRKKKGR